MWHEESGKLERGFFVAFDLQVCSHCYKTYSVCPILEGKRTEDVVFPHSIFTRVKFYSAFESVISPFL